MAIVEAFAPAKVNLTLHVTGQRGDGYHLLDSLVVFAGVGDGVSVGPGVGLTLNIEGPESDGLDAGDDNLVLRAARAFKSDRSVALTLQKNLPVASGIGGGSADAAATLKALARYWNTSLPEADQVLALGADVPVCLFGKTARIQGIGERIALIPQLPENLGLLLVNPRVGLATRLVFARLSCKENAPMPEVIPRFSGAADLADWLKRQRNDLQPPAIQEMPVIGDILGAIAATKPLLTRMSGSGATCFGLYATEDEAKTAGAKLMADHPEWWSQWSKIHGARA